jgi:deoxyribonuclease V
MIAAIDVQYDAHCGYAACVTFTDWGASALERAYTHQQHDVLDYQPGEFWKRELPCILGVLSAVAPVPTTIVIDGYVWLDGNGRPGLGAHLFDALGGQLSVVGVAKTAFRGSEHAASVCRAGSRRPLFVTAVGMPLAQAAANVAGMFGAHRIPELLKRVDQLARRRIGN